MTRVIITGAAGRMGRELLRACLANQEWRCVGATVRANDAVLGRDIGALLDAPLQQVVCTDELAPLLPHADAIIDFTSPAATLAHTAAAAAAQRPIIIGTTGFSDAEFAQLREYARTIPIVFSANFSVGVNLLWALAEQAARVWKELGAMTIDETHHVHKKDSPSGTAKTLQQRACAGSGLRAENIPITAHRRDEVIGDHSLTLDSTGETLTLSHHAKSRAIFAVGALRAATWAAHQSPGWYGMGDVLGLSLSS